MSYNCYYHTSIGLYNVVYYFIFKRLHVTLFNMCHKVKQNIRNVKEYQLLFNIEFIERVYKRIFFILSA